MLELIPGSTLAQLQNDCKLGERRHKLEKSLTSKLVSPPVADLVPEKKIADYFVQLYLDTLETTYRILHIPSFWKEYNSFWENRRGANDGFAAVLLLVIASTRCLSPAEPLSFDFDGSSARTQAISWIHACDEWYKQQSQKHRTLAMYQVQCLRVIAASINCIKTKEAYLRAETLLAYFKSSGMHRDPRLLGDKCPPFEQEMRRRLWATAAELELQASIDRGTSSSMVGLYVDCTPPLNVEDDAFSNNSEKLPIPRPSNEYTSTSFQHISARSLSLRISLTSLINNPSKRLEYDEVLSYEKQLTEHLNSLPRWPSHLHASTHLELQLRQFLLLIHSHFIYHSTSVSQISYSRYLCFENAATIIDLHTTLLQSSDFTLCLLRQDVYRAALTVCHATFTLLSELSIISSSLLLPSISATFPLTLDRAFALLSERALRPGRGFHQFWYVSAAACLVQIKLAPERAAFLKNQALERVTRLYHKVLAFREEDGDTGLLPEGGPRINSDSDRHLEPCELFDSQSWTLDDLWALDSSSYDDIEKI